MNNIDVIEADFMREYGIDLIAVFFTISYRKFMALLNALSPDAIFRLIHTSEDNDEAPVIQKKKVEDLTPAQIVARLRG